MHVQERTNRNDHPQIDVYFRACGWKNPEKIAGSAKPWCAAFVTWVVRECGLIRVIPTRISWASVRAWDALRKLIVPAATTQMGDIVTYRTWSHIEFVKSWPTDPRVRVFRAVGGNTSGGSGKQGVYVDLPRPKAYVRNTIRLVPLQ